MTNFNTTVKWLGLVSAFVASGAAHADGRSVPTEALAGSYIQLTAYINDGYACKKSGIMTVCERTVPAGPRLRFDHAEQHSLTVNEYGFGEVVAQDFQFTVPAQDAAAAEARFTAARDALLEDYNNAYGRCRVDVMDPETGAVTLVCNEQKYKVSGVKDIATGVVKVRTSKQ